MGKLNFRVYFFQISVTVTQSFRQAQNFICLVQEVNVRCAHSSTTDPGSTRVDSESARERCALRYKTACADAAVTISAPFVHVIRVITDLGLSFGARFARLTYSTGFFTGGRIVLFYRQPSSGRICPVLQVNSIEIIEGFTLRLLTGIILLFSKS